MGAYVDLDGVNDYAEANDPGGTTEKIDVRWRIENFNIAGAYNAIGSQQANNTSPGWSFWIRSDGQPYARVYPGGHIGDVGTANLAKTGSNVTANWIRFVIEYPSSGTGNIQMEVFYSNDTTEDDTIVSWTSLDTDTKYISGQTVPVNPGGEINFGGLNWSPGDRPPMDIYRAIIYHDDVVYADFWPNGDASAAGDTSWDDPDGNTWNLISNSVIGTPDGRTKNVGSISTTNGSQDTIGTITRLEAITMSSTNGSQTTVTMGDSEHSTGDIVDSGGSNSSIDWTPLWQIPEVTYDLQYVSPGALSIEPSIYGGTLISAVRVLSAANRAIYTSLDEDGVIKLPLDVASVKDLAQGIVTRSATMDVWLDSELGEVPEHAPTNRDHPLRSWSGARVEIYVGWRIDTTDYLVRRATLGVGRCRWTRREAGHQLSVDLVDLRELLDDDLDEVWTIEAGTYVGDALEDLVFDRFGGGQPIEKSQGFQDELPELVYEVGTSRLRIIDDLSIGSGLGVSFTRAGVCKIGPQLDTEVRSEPSVRYGDLANEHAIQPDVEILFSDGSISGVELTVQAASDDDEEEVVRVFDTDPDSPTFWNEGDPLGGLFAPIVAKVTSEAHTDTDVATRAAWAILRAQGRGGGDVLRFKSLPVPGLSGGDSVLVDSAELGIDDQWFTVLEVDCPLRPNMMDLTLRPSWDPTNGAGDTA